MIPTPRGPGSDLSSLPPGDPVRVCHPRPQGTRLGPVISAPRTLGSYPQGTRLGPVTPASRAPGSDLSPLPRRDPTRTCHPCPEGTRLGPVIPTLRVPGSTGVCDLWTDSSPLGHTHSPVGVGGTGPPKDTRTTRHGAKEWTGPWGGGLRRGSQGWSRSGPHRVRTVPRLRSSRHHPLKCLL